MAQQQPSLLSDDSEEARAFLQARVALFWKVLFGFFLLGSAFGVLGAVKRPGPDLLLTLALTAVAGACWWLCGRGQRSKGFSRAVEAAGLLLMLSGGALVNRYVLVGFIEQHSLVTLEGILMADGSTSSFARKAASPTWSNCSTSDWSRSSRWIRAWS